MKNQKKLIKNDGFDQNGGHHELRHEKIMNFDPGDVDFRATATRFVNIFVFLKFRVSQVLRAPSIRRRKYFYFVFAKVKEHKYCYFYLSSRN